MAILFSIAGLGFAQTADPVRVLTAQLNLEAYKSTIRDLTAFGDRRQGTDRNRAAVDWIEAQLKSYGCSNVERLRYEIGPRVASPGDREAKRRGNRGSITGVNNQASNQPNEALRELNTRPADSAPREELFCTKIGSEHPGEMYIVSAHMDGIGYGEGADDDASGTALVLELARIFSAPEVRTQRSIRFALWNGEESGLGGSRAYIEQRRPMQGLESPAGSGQYPEPRWLGVVQHDMLLFDHGMPRADGTVSGEQRPETDINIEYQHSSAFAAEAMALAHRFQKANDRYATDYPAAVGQHMSNTDSVPFQSIVAAISIRENERLTQIGNGWNPHWHQPTDVFATYSDADFRLGLNAAQTTLGAIAELAGVSITQP